MRSYKERSIEKKDFTYYPGKKLVVMHGSGISIAWNSKLLDLDPNDPKQYAKLVALANRKCRKRAVVAIKPKHEHEAAVREAA